MAAVSLDRKHSTSGFVPVFKRSEKYLGKSKTTVSAGGPGAAESAS